MSRIASRPLPPSLPPSLFLSLFLSLPASLFPCRPLRPSLHSHTYDEWLRS